MDVYEMSFPNIILLKKKRYIVIMVLGENMKEHGFTLVELIAVIVILGLLALVAVPAVTGIIKNSKDELSEAQKNNVILAAKDWASDIDNIKYLPSDGNHICVSIERLQKEGFVDLDLKDPKKSEPYKNAYIKIKRNNKNLEYAFQDEHTSSQDDSNKCSSEKLS